MARIFAIPALLALLSSIGLLSALLGDWAWDALSWLTLAIPVVVMARYAFRPAERSSSAAIRQKPPHQYSA